jgi:N-acetyl-anhydromuramyl-L-alanine amidase AmpD
MIIDTTTYQLPESNYLTPETVKKQIIIGHTGSKDMKHFTKWMTRLNGNYKKTAAFTIDAAGRVFNHFDPLFSSNLLGRVEIDKKSIIILLENEGWLTKDAERGEFLNWVGHIYNKPENVVEKRWRNYQYWSPYSEEQFNSTVELVNQLCDEFFIPKFVISHNTKVEGLDNFEGVLYKSNIDKNNTDLNPSWGFVQFKQLIENEKQDNSE